MMNPMNPMNPMTSIKPLDPIKPDSAVRRIVVVGAGLAGHECVSRLLADTSLDAEITWFGAEPDRPYNRVLLTDLLAGGHAPDAIGLPVLADGRLIDRHTHAVQAIVRGEAIAHYRQHDGAPRSSRPPFPAVGHVRVGGGETVPYDRLVLATGADPVLPSVRGNAVPLRTLNDVRTILHALDAKTRRVAVVGGGPLGIQTACALRARGLHVELLHQGPYLLNEWVEREAGDLIANSLRAGDIGVRCETRVTAATGEEWPRADLVVIACGTRPRIGLAKAAGLPTARGVLADPENCRSTGDPAVFAVGDCSQTGDTVHGLALPALDQARRAAEAILADHHQTTAKVYRAAPTLLRLRSHGVAGVETAVLAAPAAPAAVPGLRLTDQHRRTHKSLTMSRDGARIVGATLVGEVAAAAALSRLLTWPDPQPAIPVAILAAATP